MVVFLHERVEVLGAQLGLEEEGKRGVPGRAMSLKSSGSEDVLPSTSVWGFHHLFKFAFKTTVIA